MKPTRMKRTQIGGLLLAAMPIFAAATDLAALAAPKGNPTMDTESTGSLVVSKRTLRMDANGVKLAWHPAGRVFAVLDGKLQLAEFDAQTGEKLRSFPTQVHGALVGGVAYTPDGKYLLGGNGGISVFDARTGKKIREILGPYENDIHGAQGFDTLAVSHDSKQVAVRYSQYQGKNIGVIFVFDIETGEKIFSVAETSDSKHSSRFSGNLAFTPDDKLLLASRYETATHSEQLRTGEKHRFATYLDLLDARSGQRTASITPVHVMKVTALAASSDGRYIATGTNTLAKESALNPANGTWDSIDNQDPIRLWDRESGKLVREFGPLRGAVRALSFNRSGSMLASCQTDLTAKETIWLWNASNGQLIERIRTRGSAFEFFDCSFSPDGRYLAMPSIAGVELIELRK